jgi:hypothetical protein
MEREAETEQIERELTILRPTACIAFGRCIFIVLTLAVAIGALAFAIKLFRSIPSMVYFSSARCFCLPLLILFHQMVGPLFSRLLLSVFALSRPAIPREDSQRS